jgi:tetratricopeptide (TPR) repeat protein
VIIAASSYLITKAFKLAGDKIEIAYDQIQQYKEATELDPKYASTWNNKGNALGNLGRYEEAIEHFDKAIELDPNNAYAWNNKGLALGNLGKHQEAIEHCDKAIELAPKYADAWYNRASYKIKINDVDNGLEDLSKAVKINKEIIELAKQDKSFEAIRNDERFRKLSDVE